MDDLAATLSNILNTKEGQEQLRNIQSMLGMNSNGQGSAPPSAPPPEAPANNGSGGGFDFSALAGMLSGMNNSSGQADAPPAAAPEAPANNGGGGGFDFSALAGMLSGMNGGGGQAPASPPDGGGMPQIDMDMILKIQQVFRSMNVNDKNSQLLLALKPHFGERRQKKVDQAMSLMRLFSMLPMLKESGLFAGL